MSIWSSLGQELLRAAVSLGFLGCFIAAGPVSSQAAASESSVVANKTMMGVAVPGISGSRCANADGGSDLMLTGQVEIGLPDEFGVAFEDDDSIEMLRVDIRQRVFGIDHFVIGPRGASHTARNIRSSISSPLLV